MTLTLCGHDIQIPMRINREDLNRAVSFTLARLVQVIGKKQCSQVPPF